MNPNSEALITFCIYTSKEEDFIKNHEFYNLIHKLESKNIELHELIHFSKEDFINKLNFDIAEALRFIKIRSRQLEITSKIHEYENNGIKICTIYDEFYPQKIKSKLQFSSPVLFYYVGNTEILNKKSVAFTGSRELDDFDNDKYFVETIADKVLDHGYTIVTGGAKGIDTIASDSALSRNENVIEFLSCNLLKKSQKSNLKKHISNGNLLLLSAVTPTANFNVNSAMSRNKFIYCQADSAVIVKSNFEYGGTWKGALEALNKKYCKIFCWDCSLKGNNELIKLGAVPVNENCDFMII